MLSELPWLPAGDVSGSLRIAPVRWRRALDRRILHWHKPLANVFDHLELERPLLDLERLSQDPTSLFDSSPTAALVRGSAAGYIHRAPVGTHARETRSAGRLGRRRPARPDRKVPTTATDATDPRRPHHQPRQNNDVPPSSEAQAPTSSLMTFCPRAAVVEALANYLGLIADETMTDGDTTTWKGPEITVQLRCRRVGGLAAPFDLDQGVKNRELQLRRAVDARRKEVEAVFRGSVRGAAIVEIRDPAQFTNRRTDPKRALRLGLADIGRHHAVPCHAFSTRRGRDEQLPA